MLVIVPMFHANAWGTPYAAWMIGADLVFPQQFLQAAPLARIIADTRPTLTGAVPTVLNDLLVQRRRRRPVVVPAGDGRRLGAAAQAVRGLPRHLRRPARAGLGDDRDQPGVHHRPPAGGHGRQRRDRLAGHAGRILPGVSCGSPTTSARRCRGTASRSARSRSRAVDHRRVLRRRRRRRSSTTAGCAPATSPR